MRNSLGWYYLRSLDQGGDGQPASSPTFPELLIDCEEDRMLRAALVGMLRDAERER
jgi:hypothetical protein